VPGIFLPVIRYIASCLGLLSFLVTFAYLKDSGRDRLRRFLVRSSLLLLALILGVFSLWLVGSEGNLGASAWWALNVFCFLYILLFVCLGAVLSSAGRLIIR
jgi:hypothetical protein